MSSNERKIREGYADGGEDERATKTRAGGLEFHFTKKLLSPYLQPDSRVIELGCATGYYGLFFAEACAEYVGIDLSPENIAIFKQKIADRKLQNVSASVGDATALDQIPDGRFDVVLCLGPMYHLPAAERSLVFEECRRIAAEGAVCAFAYIPPTGAYLKASLMWPSVYPNEKANECCLRRGVDDIRPDVFFYSSPEQLARCAQAHGFSVIRNAGTDFTFDDELINRMSEAQFQAWLAFSDEMVASESCTGLSNHSLLICKK